jgi:hypothetical protein
MAMLQEKPELTARGIPVSLRAFFQEYELESLDPDRSAFTVMERTLAWGDIAELRWLFGLYANQRLKGFVRKFGWRVLPRRRFKFWVCFFGLSAYEQGERIWPH